MFGFLKSAPTAASATTPAAAAAPARSGGTGFGGFMQGAKYPLQATSKSNKFGSFLRYMLDEEALKTAQKQSLGGSDIAKELGGLPLSKVSKDKEGNVVATYGAEKEDKLASLIDSINKKDEEQPVQKGSFMSRFFENLSRTKKTV